MQAGRGGESLHPSKLAAIDTASMLITELAVAGQLAARVTFSHNERSC